MRVLLHHHFDHADILKGFIFSVGRDALYFLHHIQSFNHPTEDSIGIIQMGCPNI